MTRVALVLAILSWGCPGGASQRTMDRPPPASGDAAAGSARVNKKLQDDGGTFVRGPAVSPAPPLIAWLDAQVRDGEPRLVRLPVVLKKGPMGISKQGATIGAGPDAIAIYPNDTALGVALVDRARTACKDSPLCAMWLEGYWRGKQDGDYTFDVMTVRDPIAADALAAASYAEVQGESGN